MPSPEQERLDAIAQNVGRIFQRLDDLETRLARLERSPKPDAVSAPSSPEKPAAYTRPARPKPVLETKVGLTILNRVGVVTLILGVAFFFKWAVDNNWIGPSARLILGVVAALLILVLAETLWRKAQDAFAQGLTALGLAVLYISLYTADVWRFSSVTVAFLLLFGWQAGRTSLDRRVAALQTPTALSINALAYFAASYGLLETHHHAYLSLLAMALAALYLGLGAFLYRRPVPADRRPALVSLGLAICFLTLAIPLQFTGCTITIAWSLEAAILAWVGARFASRPAPFGALVLFAFVLLRLLAIDTGMFGRGHSYLLLWNARFLTFAVAGACLFLAAHWSAAKLRSVALAEYLGGHVALLWGLSLEILAWAEVSTPPDNLVSVQTVSLSILFAVYASLFVALGVATRTTLNRIAGLALFGIIILKLYIFDVWQLNRIYRISAFAALGALLIGTSFLYSRFRRLIETFVKDDKSRKAYLVE